MFHRVLKASALGQPRGIGCGVWEGGSGWKGTCAPMGDSCQCMLKTTTILWGNQPPIKINTLIMKKNMANPNQSVVLSKKKKCIVKSCQAWDHVRQNRRLDLLR